MIVERRTTELVDEIDRQYLALKPKYSAQDIVRTINSILLNEGVTKQELSRAWDGWFAKHGGSENALQ